jgi:hypothetical protein
MARSEQSSSEAVVQDRTYRGQVFKADASGIAAGTPLYLDRVELLLHTYSATSSAVLVSLQNITGDTDVLAYDCNNQGSEDYVHSSHYAANTFQPSTWGYLSKVGINVKKVGSPEDLIVELRGADPSTGAPTSTLASGTLPAASVSSSSFQTFNVTLDPPAEYLDDGAWYTVVLRQKDDGGNGTNEYLVSTSSGTSCGADAKGWELVGGSWASSYVHYLKVYVAGPTDFTPREDIVAESRIPTSALPACSSGCERWVPVRFNTPITLANMSYYAVVAREEGGSSDVYWMLHGTSGNSTSYAVGRESGAWLMGRTYNPSERDMDYQTHALRVYANGPAIPSGTIQLSSIPLGSADWVETTLPGYGIAAAEPKVISLDARSGGVDADRYVIWAGAPSGTDAYGPGYAGSGSAYGTYGSATAAGDRGFGTWDSESTERSCSATWDTNWLTDGTATQDGVEYHVRFRAQDEAGNTGSGGAAFAPPEIVANEGVSEE